MYGLHSHGLRIYGLTRIPQELVHLCRADMVNKDGRCHRREPPLSLVHHVLPNPLHTAAGSTISCTTKCVCTQARLP